jgi:hypothetical protein
LFSSCYDSEKFNVYERVIQGWSAGLVKHFIEIGVRSKLSAKDLILLATNTKYRMKYEKYYLQQNSFQKETQNKCYCPDL